MGDSGSLLLGFSFAAVTLSAGHQAPGRSDVLSIVAAPVLVLLIPIFDTTLVTLSRWLSGRRASQGGRDHSSHRLVAIGLSERRAVTLLWLLAAVGGVLGVVARLFRAAVVVVVGAAGGRLRPRDDRLRRLPGRHPRVRRRRRARESGHAHADRRRLHVQAAGRRGAARLLPRSRSATTRRTACGSKIRTSS